MWAFGRVDLFLSEQDWACLTLYEFSLLTSRHNKINERERRLADHRAAMITAMVHNSTVGIVSALVGKKVGKQAKIKDYMPAYKEKRKKTWQEMKAITQAWAASLKGR